MVDTQESLELVIDLGDNAEMCMIELVDFNEVYTKEETKKTTRRSRRGGKKSVDFSKYRSSSSRSNEELQ